MIPILIDGPAVEPVGLPEMRAYLRLDDTAEDDLIVALIKAARLLVEAASRRILVAQRWRLTLDAWPDGRAVSLPMSPLIGVAQVQVTDSSGAAAAVPVGQVRAEIACDPPRVVADAAVPEPGVARSGIAIEVDAGFGAAPEDVPEPLRLAIKMLVARWFENRGDLAGEQTLPPEVTALVAPYKRARL